MSKTTNKDKIIKKKLSGRELSDRHIFEVKHNLTGFFKLLLEIDMRNSPQLYENNRNTNNPNQS